MQAIDEIKKLLLIYAVYKESLFIKKHRLHRVKQYTRNKMSNVTQRI